VRCDTLTFRRTAAVAVAALLSLVLPSQRLAMAQAFQASEDGTVPEVKLGPHVAELKVGPKMNAVGKRLRDSSFVAQDLSGAVFDGCDLPGVEFYQCDLMDASFRNADLTGTVFHQCELYRTSFRDVDLTGADFDGCSLDGADFTNARIDGRKLKTSAFSAEQIVSTRSYKEKRLAYCEIPGVGGGTADRPEPLPPRFYDFHKAILDHALMSGDFRGCDFTDASIDEISLFNCEMSFTQLASTKNFKNRNLRHMELRVEFDGPPDFAGIDLTGTKLMLKQGQPAKFTGATITDCTFYGTAITKERLFTTKNYKDGDLAGITFSGIDFSKCDFSRQNLIHASFLDCDLTGTNFQDAVITHTCFSGASWSAHPTADQIKSTWNYKNNRMEGIVLPKDDVSPFERK
jgi:uncharacterized protein YjbI with pentapeptide repeats